MNGGELIGAAGAVPWRRASEKVEVALVHRARYDDWSWPKGKLDDGEVWPAAAVREVAEETGLGVRLGRPLPTARYEVCGAPKEVRYWAGEVIAGDGHLDHEVDALDWLPPEAARARLSYERDRDQLDALVDLDDADRLDTRPFLLVRHAKALARRDWPKTDGKRPLDGEGFAQAEALPALLAAYGVNALVSSTSTRCRQTFEPAASAIGRTIERERALSEESFAKHPKRAVAAFTAALTRPDVVALCTHRPLIPIFFEALAERARGKLRKSLQEQARDGLAKGEVLVAHLRAGRRDARVADVERHRPLT